MQRYNAGFRLEKRSIEMIDGCINFCRSYYRLKRQLFSRIPKQFVKILNLVVDYHNAFTFQ